MRDGEEVERNIRRQEQEDDLMCKIEGCVKRYKSKGGLKIHQKRMHGTKKKEFRCVCGLVLWSENALVNHSKACTGERAETEKKRRCEKCRKEFSKNNIARHRRTCTVGERDGGVQGDVRQQERPPEETSARVYRPKWAHCPQCGQLKSATNMARHRTTCRGGGGDWWRGIPRKRRTPEKKKKKKTDIIVINGFLQLHELAVDFFVIFTIFKIFFFTKNPKITLYFCFWSEFY